MQVVTMTDEEYIEHFGVKGMKWGKRKGPVDKQGNLKRPSYMRTLALGAAGNSKKRFTDPKANRQRTKAGKLALTGALLTAGSVAVATLGSKSSNGDIRAGSAIVANLLSAGGGVVGVTGIGLALNATAVERDARAAG